MGNARSCHSVWQYSESESRVSADDGMPATDAALMWTAGTGGGGGGQGPIQGQGWLFTGEMRSCLAACLALA